MAASVSVAVDARGPHFEYRYRVSNGAGADPIRHLEMEVPVVGDEAYDISAPKDWLSAVDRQTGVGFPSPVGPPLSGRLRWSINDGTQIGQPQVSAIMAGTGRQGFAVTTSLRPGFTTMLVVGQDTPVLGNEIPLIVREQAQPMLRYNRQPVLTIGPRYPEDAPMIEVVAGFHSGIAMLVRYGRLARTSPGVIEALGQLKGFLEYAEAVYSVAGDVRSDEMTGPKLVFRESPQGGVEAEILESMKLSLTK